MKNVDAITLGILIGLVIGLFIGGTLRGVSMREAAIQNGVAHYNPTNAAFTWGSFTNR